MTLFELLLGEAEATTDERRQRRRATSGCRLDRLTGAATAGAEVEGTAAPRAAEAIRGEAMVALLQSGERLSAEARAACEEEEEQSREEEEEWRE